MATTFFRQSQADKTSAMSRHKVNMLGRHKPGTNHKVAFIFTILVVHQDHHLPFPVIRKYFLDWAHTRIGALFCHFINCP